MSVVEVSYSWVIHFRHIMTLKAVVNHFLGLSRIFL
ncbi:hypothetical protein BCEN4_740146 [Burkholderia cenocepacia]|nr:hypothetical protein BCEN4_740146 [Burkholderia cenocepacia]